MEQLFRDLSTLLAIRINMHTQSTHEVERTAVSSLRIIKQGIDDLVSSAALSMVIYNNFLENIRLTRAKLPQKIIIRGGWLFSSDVEVPCDLGPALDTILRTAEASKKEYLDAQAKASQKPAVTDKEEKDMESRILGSLEQKLEERLKVREEQGFAKGKQQTEKEIAEKIRGLGLDPATTSKIYLQLGWHSEQAAPEKKETVDYKSLPTPQAKLKACLGTDKYSAVMQLNGVQLASDFTPADKLQAKLVVFWIMKYSRQFSLSDSIDKACAVIQAAQVKLSHDFTQKLASIKKLEQPGPFLVGMPLNQEEIKICFSSYKKSEKTEGVLEFDAAASKYFETMHLEMNLRAGETLELRKKKYLDETTYRDFFAQETRKLLPSGSGTSSAPTPSAPSAPRA